MLQDDSIIKNKTTPEEFLDPIIEESDLEEATQMNSTGRYGDFMYVTIHYDLFMSWQWDLEEEMQIQFPVFVPVMYNDKIMMSGADI